MPMPHPGYLSSFFIYPSGLPPSSLKTRLAAVSAFHEGKCPFLVIWLIRRMIGQEPPTLGDVKLISKLAELFLVSNGFVALNSILSESYSTVTVSDYSIIQCLIHLGCRLHLPERDSMQLNRK